MTKTKKRDYFDLDVLCQGVDCQNCIHRYDEYGYTECLQNYKCEKIINDVEYFLEAGSLENDGGFIDYAENILDDTANAEFWVGHDLSTHPIWWISFNGLKPIGMDSVEEILHEAFI